MRKTPVVTGGLLFVLILSACGGGTPESNDGQQVATPPAAESAVAGTPSVDETTSEANTDSPNPSQTDAPTRSDSPPGESGDPSPDETESANAESSPGAVVLSPDKKGQTLTLADFFNPDSDWTENRYDVADEGAVSGISYDVQNCGPGYSTDSLELRLANNFETLNFRVGQANSSEVSDQNLVVRVEGNGKQLDVQRVPFNEIQEISVPVDGVNAAILQFYLDDEMEGCGSGNVQAVVYDAELQ